MELRSLLLRLQLPSVIKLEYRLFSTLTKSVESLAGYDAD